MKREYVDISLANGNTVKIPKEIANRGFELVGKDYPLTEQSGKKDYLIIVDDEFDKDKLKTMLKKNPQNKFIKYKNDYSKYARLLLKGGTGTYTSIAALSVK